MATHTHFFITEEPSLNKHQRNALRRFRRVQEFLAATEVAGTNAQVQALADVIQELSETGTEQDASHRQARGEVARQRALRQELWVHHLTPISRLARRIFGVPGMDVKLRMPPHSADNEAYIAAATGMAEAAEPHASEFVARGLPQDFVQQARAAAGALSAAVGTRVQATQRRSRAVQSLPELVKRGCACVDMLDAIASSRLASQPALLAAWKGAKRSVDVGAGGAPPAAPESPELRVA